MEKLKGIIPALYTTYDEEGEICTAGLEDMISFLSDRGCSGFFVGGSTGEGLLQNTEERKKYIEAVVRTVAGQLPVIAHVGALSRRDACELARFSAQVGADAVSSIMPAYYAVGMSDAADYLRAIAQSAELPLIIYYLERTATGNLDAKTFAENFGQLPYLLGMKYTSPNLETFRKIIDYTGGELNMFIGCDQVFLPARIMGADGGIGSTFNFMPELFVEIDRLYNRGEIARAQQLMFRAFRLLRLLLEKYPLLEAGRCIMKLRGLETGHCRLPVPRLTSQQQKQLELDLKTWDFFSEPLR